MIEIYLMRHGIAVDTGSQGVTTDADRPLTGEGRTKVEQEALALQELDLKFNLILTSPYQRCRETAELVAARLDLEHRVKIIDSLAPGRAFGDGEGPHAEIFIELGAWQFDRVLLVGHMPDLAEIGSYLLTGNRNLNLDFKRGTVCAIEIASLPPRGPGLLRWMMTPRQLRRLAKSRGR